MLRQRVLNGTSNVQMGTNPFLFSVETHAQWHRKVNQRSSWFMALNHSFQSPYNKRSDFDRVVLHGNRYSTHWHMALSHLYRSTENWTLLFGLTKKYTLMCYMKEDFRVDNAPDLQTGMTLLLPLK